MTYVAEFSNSKAEGTTIRIARVSLARLAFNEAAWCLCDFLFWITPGWAYEVRWGPKDEYGIADRSIGHLSFELCQRLADLTGTGKVPGEPVPVSYEWVRKNRPELGWPFDGSVPDDD